VEAKLIWFDSFGAKSSCTLVTTPNLKILIDPGVAIMHPSFPASWEDKERWTIEGRNKIISALQKADIVIVSHYHWDHFIPDRFDLYYNKTLFIKNPNEYINDSQRERAFEFFKGLLGEELRIRKGRKKKYKDLAEELNSINLDFGDYNPRRKELLEKGRKWFEKRAENWSGYEKIKDGKYKRLEIVYPEGKTFKIKGVKLKFSNPLFHGIEYSRTGWVFWTLIEYKGYKVLHSSDVNGPIIEDYADWIIDENPDFIILDGPMTYMLGYTLNLINFNRVLQNVKRIIEECDFEILIWDHHLPREKRFRERTKEVWELAKKLNKKVLTASEFQLGKKPIVEQV